MIQRGNNRQVCFFAAEDSSELRGKANGNLALDSTRFRAQFCRRTGAAGDAGKGSTAEQAKEAESPAMFGGGLQI